jgi:hypothetical protein
MPCVVCPYLGVEVIHQYDHVLGSSLIYHCLVEIIFLFLFLVIGGSLALFDV